MALQNIPQYQQRALPISSIGGTVQVIGGQAVRYYSPADVGINAAHISTLAITGGSYYYLGGDQANWLDLRGTTKASILLERTPANNSAAAFGCWAQVQIRAGGSDVPPVTYDNGVAWGTQNEAFAAKVYVNTTSVTFPAPGAGLGIQRVLFSWAGIVQAGYAPAIVGGTDVRLIFTWVSNNPALNAGDTFSASLWAMS